MPQPIIQHTDWPARGADIRSMLGREWLLANGLGGYSGSTVLGVATRRYHGLLTAALPKPFGRVAMFNHATEELHVPGGPPVRLGGHQPTPTRLDLPEPDLLTGFKLEQGLPVWRYELRGLSLEKRLVMVHGRNTVHLLYRALTGRGRLRLQPAVCFRRQSEPPRPELDHAYRLSRIAAGIEIVGPGDLPCLRLRPRGTTSGLPAEPGILHAFYSVDRQRGYPAEEALWSPGWLEFSLVEGQSVALTGSTETWTDIADCKPWADYEAELDRRHRLVCQARPPLRQGIGAELVLAADQFIVTPQRQGGPEGAVDREHRSIIAGYPWFTDWGRDTMISLDGLALATGRHDEARRILRMFTKSMRNGLIPNQFPEGDDQGLYNTADGSLWLFHAVHRYVEVTGDRDLLRELLPGLRQVVDCYIAGTDFGIGIDPGDGLVRESAPEVPLTWMDAKVGDWVVTPRRGKPVEINALWYNALKRLEGWLREEDGSRAAEPMAQRADQVWRSFNARFWYDAGAYLYDVVDGPVGNDASLRPNQMMAIALPNPVLDPSRRPAVMKAIQGSLLTPVGLRSLAPDDPDYRKNYFGDRRSRDAAYHQGVVWPWLLGPFADAWIKTHPGDRMRVRRLFDDLALQLDQACIGSIAEIFDAGPPFQARGCVAQAWSVAEAIRILLGTAENGAGPQR